MYSDGLVTITRGAEAVVWCRGPKWAARGFCQRCGTSLFYRLENQPELFAIIAGDALNFLLQRHIETDAQPASYSFPDHQPRVTKVELMKKFGVSPVYAAVAQHTFFTAHLRALTEIKTFAGAGEESPTRATGWPVNLKYTDINQ